MTDPPPVRPEKPPADGGPSTALRAGVSKALVGEDRQSPTIHPEELAALLDQLRRAQTQLAQRSVDHILASLNAVVRGWLEPDSPWRQEAENTLPAATGFSPAMVREGLPLMIEPLAAPALATLLDTELGNRRVLDDFIEGRRARGPRLIAHVLAGNLPGLAAVPAALTLAVKSAALVKAARCDRVFPALWCRSIAAVDADLGTALSACYWHGGDHACEQRVFEAADLVIASGSDASIADMRSRCRARFIGHGHKVSFAVVAREVLADHALADQAAAALGYDIALWDQRGCLSPQIAFVEGDFRAARRFAERLAEALGALAVRLPPGAAGFQEQLDVRLFRQEVEWRRIAGEPVALLAGEGLTDWTIAVDAHAVFRPTPLCRSVRLIPLPALADLAPVLAPVRGVLEAAGVGASPARLAALAELLSEAGVHRVCALGRMQRPPLSWRQGGRPRVADWVMWTNDDRTS